MERIGLTRASIVVPIAVFLERMGAPVERLMEKAGLPGWILAAPEALIPASGVARFLFEAARAEAIDDLGILAAQGAPIETLGVYGHLIRRSTTLGEALDAVVHAHSAFSSNGRIWLAPRGDDVQLCGAFVCKHDALDEGWKQTSHYILMLLLGVIRLGAGPTWRPREVHLQTGESVALRDAEPLAGARVLFGQPAMAIIFPRALLNAPLREPTASAAIPQKSIDAWKASAPADDFVRSVFQVVDMLSWEDYPDIHRTAGVLGMSARTLQRHLTAAGVTHESLLDRVRFATAAGLLEDTDTRVLDIALDLGYSDHAHFTRAFRRWAGCSPQEYRRNRTERPNLRAAGT